MTDALATRSYTKGELAFLAGVSVRYMWTGIHHDPELMNLLNSAGYKKNQRTLTPKQSSIILEFYGLNPDTNEQQFNL